MEVSIPDAIRDYRSEEVPAPRKDPRGRPVLVIRVWRDRRLASMDPWPVRVMFTKHQADGLSGERIFRGKLFWGGTSSRCSMMSSIWKPPGMRGRVGLTGDATPHPVSADYFCFRAANRLASPRLRSTRRDSPGAFCARACASAAEPTFVRFTSRRMSPGCKPARSAGLPG